jgi:hypothetical protein
MVFFTTQTRIDNIIGAYIMARIKIHEMEEHRELAHHELDHIRGGQSNYTGMDANSGTKTGGDSSNYGNVNAGSGGQGGSASGNTSGSNFAGTGCNASQYGWDGKINSSNTNAGAGGSITNIGAQAGSGGAGGTAIGSQGGNVTDNIITEISIPVTMNL